MSKSLLAGFMSLWLAVAAVAASPIVWQRYTNETFGYSVDLPLGALFGSNNGDKGVTLVEPNGRGQIDVYGAVNAQNLTSREFERELSRADRIREITYARRGSSWFVISGYYRRENDEADDLIFYAKFMFSPDRRVVSAFEASYPIVDKRRYDPIIERMEDSLRSPKRAP
jgi:hypothetical protein